MASGEHYNRGRTPVKRAPNVRTSTNEAEPCNTWLEMRQTSDTMNGRATARPHDDPPGGHETILLVEDEPLVMKVNVHELERLGYRVVCARSGEEALRYLQDQTADLLLLDLMMPGLDGVESFRRIKQVRPGLKAMVYSGYAHPEKIAEIQALGASPILLKPATLPVLAAAIRARLDEPG
jgi:CheY-like chemotaxis protein